ncbi:MAG: tRNA (guanosine(37)-N1)-methyltransferase TrmD [Rubellimicrobium sp.]|nr:tRNA (guanosine(37)-N1)-methyltransferase TrmD [Rubellimicrobium sp.]
MSAAPWEARVITLVPQAWPGVLGHSLTGRALAEGLWRLDAIDLRDFGDGPHRKVDDTPAGGGPGLVLRPDVMAAAIRAARAGAPADAPLIHLSPRGAPFTQARAQALAAGPGVVLVCGRFEGLDQRVIDAFGAEEISLGDFVLTGGDIAAMALLDATVRLIPRVLGNQGSVEDESFSHGLLEHPQYTKPAIWEGRAIPEILLSGHHARIETWRRDMAERLTKERRPDLWRAYRAVRDMDPVEDQSSRRARPLRNEPQADEGASDGPDR